MPVSLPSPGGDSEDKPDQPAGQVHAAVEEPKSRSSHDATGYAPTYGTSATDLLPPELWDAPNLAEALVSRDIAQLFRFLQNHGVSQRRIAAHTGQAQSEISEILAGRTVTSYPVLERIALGLGIPRGRLGLAHDENQRPASQPSITQLSRYDRPSEPRAEPARGMDPNADIRTSDPALQPAAIAPPEVSIVPENRSRS